MQPQLKKTLRLLYGRLALNIYFWAFIILLRIDADAPFWVHVYEALLYVVTIALVYLNNMVLIPRLLVRKKYPGYFSLIFLATLIASCIYWLLVHHARQTHPDTAANAYSIVVTGSWRAGYHYLNYLNEVNACFSYLASFVVIFTMAWYMRDYSRQRRLAAELRQKQLETELQVLKGQLNPHFLFNTLNNLYGLAMEDGPGAANAILRLSSVLRYSLYQSSSKQVDFKLEQQAMQAYIDLELLRIRKKEQLSFTFTSDDPDACVAPLLWMPVLENVFKHGTRFIDITPTVDFRYTINDGRLGISSRNCFKPRTESNGESNEPCGIGLTNLRQRLLLLYPGKHIIQTGVEDEHYFVRIEIELS